MVNAKSQQEKRTEKDEIQKDVVEIFHNQIRKTWKFLHVFIQAFENRDFRTVESIPGRFSDTVVQAPEQPVLAVSDDPENVRTEILRCKLLFARTYDLPMPALSPLYNNAKLNSIPIDFFFAHIFLKTSSSTWEAVKTMLPVVRS